MAQTQLPVMPISDRVKHIPQALSVYINQLVYDLRRRQRDIIALSLGEAFFSIPRFSFEKLDFERGYHYSDSQGLPDLRNKIAGFYNKQYGSDIDGKKHIIISAGSKPIIFMCMQAVLDVGDDVVIHEPAWVSYQEQARLCGGEVNFIPFSVPVSEFHRHFTPRTRMMIINNPNNPAGRLYSREELLDLYQQCRSRGIYLLVDEAYSDFVLDGSFVTAARLSPDLDGIIAVNSLSKNMGMSGWRVGYAIAAPRFIAQLLKLNQHIITCAPTILLQYLIAYFDDILAVTLPQVRAVVEKRDRIAHRMKELGIRHLPGGSTFYFFIDTAPFTGDAFDLAMYMLLDKDVALVPGSAYGASTERFLRMSIGTETEERIDQALQALRATLDSGFDSEYVRAEFKRLNLPTLKDA
ncbi:MAG TPA: pyridoxal phosphate-dependent aminotransferase [Magnetospirillaceae bacterium]|jgi:aspartate aminotransferase/aminotransferase